MDDPNRETIRFIDEAKRNICLKILVSYQLESSSSSCGRKHVPMSLRHQARPISEKFGQTV